MTYSTAEGREPRFVVSDGSSHLDKPIIIIIIIITIIIITTIIIIIIIIPDDVFNALRCKDEKEEEEEVRGGVADELQEWLSAEILFAIISI